MLHKIENLGMFWPTLSLQLFFVKQKPHWGGHSPTLHRVGFGIQSSQRAEFLFQPIASNDMSRGKTACICPCTLNQFFYLGTEGPGNAGWTCSIICQLWFQAPPRRCLQIAIKGVPPQKQTYFMYSNFLSLAKDMFLFNQHGTSTNSWKPTEKFIEIPLAWEMWRRPRTAESGILCMWKREARKALTKKTNGVNLSVCLCVCVCVCVCVLAVNLRFDLSC